MVHDHLVDDAVSLGCRGLPWYGLMRDGLEPAMLACSSLMEISAAPPGDGHQPPSQRSPLGTQGPSTAPCGDEDLLRHVLGVVMVAE